MTPAVGAAVLIQIEEVLPYIINVRISQQIVCTWQDLAGVHQVPVWQIRIRHATGTGVSRQWSHIRDRGCRQDLDLISLQDVHEGLQKPARHGRRRLGLLQDAARVDDLLIEAQIHDQHRGGPRSSCGGRWPAARALRRAAPCHDP